MPERKWLLVALLVVALVVVPQIAPLATDQNLTILLLVFMAASMASSWNIIAGYAGQITLGHVAFFGLGALTTRQLWLSDFPFALSFLAGGLVAAAAALIIGVPALRLKGIYFSIGTLALAEALRLTVANLLPQVSALRGPQIASYNLSERYYLSLAVIILIVAISYWLSRSRLGLGMMAVREDEDAARAIGINVFLHTLTAFVLSAFLAGLTGSTFAFFHPSYYASYAFGPVWTFDALLVTFVGGVGTVIGPLVGAVFFVLVRDVLASNLVNIHLIVFGVVFIIVVLVLPGGMVEISTRVGEWFAGLRAKKKKASAAVVSERTSADARIAEPPVENARQLEDV